MSSRIALIVLGCCVVMAQHTAFAQGADLICAGEAGPLLVVGPNGVNRLGLTGPEGGRVLEMERWSICFGCAGFPRLDIALKDLETGKDDVRVLTEPRGCADSMASETPTAEQYCIGETSVWVGHKDTLKCRFPEGTSLAALWKSLTRSPPPDKIRLWWSYQRR